MPATHLENTMRQTKTGYFDLHDYIHFLVRYRRLYTTAKRPVGLYLEYGKN
jgi:hypothetical protein